MQLSAKEKITSWMLRILFILLVPAVAYVASQDVKTGIMVIVGLIGLTLCAISLLNYRWGFYIFITFCLTISFFKRLYGQQMNIGVAMDTLLFCTFLGCIMKGGDPGLKRVPFSKDPLMMMFYLYVLVLFTAVANPVGASVAGWAIFMRIVLRGVILVYLALNVFSDRASIRTFIKFWLVICTLAAFYACIQDWFGLMPWEQAYLNRYKDIMGTTLIMGGIRIFSFMTDAAVLGIILACNSVMLLIFLTASKEAISYPKKALITIATILHLMGLAYTGTRTGYVLVPLGLLLFFIVNVQKKNTILIAIAFGMFAVVILFGPFHGNPTVQRVRSAFLGKKEASMIVRDKNRHSVQQYIYKHPLGGGLMTTGANGLNYNPWHPLADFQTDNGYLRMALEAGWLGLLASAGTLFLLIRGAIINFFRLKDELDKLIMLAIAAGGIGIALAQYTQDATTLVESAIMYNAFMAIVVRSRYFNEPNKHTN